MLRIFAGRLSRRSYVLGWFLPTLVMARFRDGGLSGWWYVAAGSSLALRLAILGWYVIFLPILGDLETMIGAGMGGLHHLPPANRIADLVFFIVLAMGVSWLFYRLVLRAGDRGPNKYGPDPLVRPTFGTTA